MISHGISPFEFVVSDVFHFNGSPLPAFGSALIETVGSSFKKCADVSGSAELLSYPFSYFTVQGPTPHLALPLSRPQTDTPMKVLHLRVAGRIDFRLSTTAVDDLDLESKPQEHPSKDTQRVVRSKRRAPLRPLMPSQLTSLEKLPFPCGGIVECSWRLISKFSKYHRRSSNIF